METATSLQALRVHLGFTVEQMAQTIGLPVSVYAIAEIGFKVGHRHRDQFIAFFESEWLADAVLRRPDRVVLSALGIETDQMTPVRDPYR